MNPRTTLATLIIAALATLPAAGCGDDDEESTDAQSVAEGDVVYRDALDDNSGGWLPEDDLVYFRGGRWVWRKVPDGGAAALPDALLEKSIPAGLSVSAEVTMDAGAALRGVNCRELGPRDEPAQDWYELGIDGRRALIRRMKADSPPKVLTSTDAPVPNGRTVRVTGQCVPDGEGGLVLALQLDGREVARATDTDPLSATRDGVEGTTAIFAYARPDSDGPANLTWDNFSVRNATLGAASE